MVLYECLYVGVSHMELCSVWGIFNLLAIITVMTRVYSNYIFGHTRELRGGGKVGQLWKQKLLL